MRKRLKLMFIFGVFALIVSGCSLTGGAPKVDDDQPEHNVVINPSFEEINESNGIPVEWTTNTYSGGDAAFSVDEDVTRTGQYSVRIDGVSDASQTRGAVRQVVPVDGGSLYRFNGWFQAEDVTNREAVTVRLVFRSTPSSNDTIGLGESDFQVIEPGDDDYLIQASLFWIYPAELPKEGWGNVASTFRAPSNATHVWIQLFHNDLNGNEGTVWWDDISLVPIS